MEKALVVGTVIEMGWVIGWMVGKVGERKGKGWGVVQGKWVSEWRWVGATDWLPPLSRPKLVFNSLDERGRKRGPKWGGGGPAWLFSEGLYIGPFVSQLAPSSHSLFSTLSFSLSNQNIVSPFTLFFTPSLSASAAPLTLLTLICLFCFVSFYPSVGCFFALWSGTCLRILLVL